MPHAVRVPDNELLDCLARGWTMGEIAEEYGLKRWAVVAETNRLRDLVQARNVTHLVGIYMREGPICFDAAGQWRPRFPGTTE